MGRRIWENSHFLKSPGTEASTWEETPTYHFCTLLISILMIEAFLWNVGIHLQDCMVSQFRKPQSKHSSTRNLYLVSLSWTVLSHICCSIFEKMTTVLILLLSLWWAKYILLKKKLVQ
jgi:hypothetical protein